MAHYAFINSEGLVIEVITGRDEDDLVDGVEDWEIYYAQQRGVTCKRTSYNTYGGTHSNGGVPLRKNYAGVGFTYDHVRDAFIPPKPSDDAVLNEETCLWELPPTE